MTDTPAWNENVFLPETTGGKKKRIYEVDLLRALPLFLVVLFHLCYDMSILPQLIANYREVVVDYPSLHHLVLFCSDIMTNEIIHDYLVPFFAGMFLFACGVSTVLSRNNLKRALVLCLWSLLLSLGSFLLTDLLGTNVFIGWGILHIMAFSILCYSLIEILCRKAFHREVPALLCLGIGILVYLFGLLLRAGFVGPAWPVLYVRGTLLEWLEVNPLAFLYSALGYYGNSVDWWPIFPYLGVIFIGIAFGKGLYAEKKESRLPFLGKKAFKPLLFLGGHTIWVYLLHQPVIIVVLYLVLSSMGFHL